MHTLTAFIDTIFETATEIASNKTETASSRKGSQFEVIENERISGVVLEDLTISGSLFSLTTFVGVTFDSCAFFGSKIENCDFVNCNFIDCSKVCHLTIQANCYDRLSFFGNLLFNEICIYCIIIFIYIYKHHVGTCLGDCF